MKTSDIITVVIALTVVLFGYAVGHSVGRVQTPTVSVAQQDNIVALEQRIVALEGQVAELQTMATEMGNRLAALEGKLDRAEQRIADLLAILGEFARTQQQGVTP